MTVAMTIDQADATSSTIIVTPCISYNFLLHDFLETHKQHIYNRTHNATWSVVFFFFYLIFRPILLKPNNFRYFAEQR